MLQHSKYCFYCVVDELMIFLRALKVLSCFKPDIGLFIALKTSMTINSVKVTSRDGIVYPTSGRI